MGRVVNNLKVVFQHFCETEFKLFEPFQSGDYTREIPGNLWNALYFRYNINATNLVTI